MIDFVSDAFRAAREGVMTVDEVSEVMKELYDLDWGWRESQ
jgi:hypothetical protein